MSGVLPTGPLLGVFMTGVIARFGGDCTIGVTNGNTHVYVYVYMYICMILEV